MMGRSLLVVEVVVACVSVALACKGTFDGPYACATGYASCTTASSCETETATDGANCGGCGHACAPGAACTNGRCGAPPAVFLRTPSPTYLALSPSSVLAWVGASGSGSGTSPGMNSGDETSTLYTSPTSSAGAVTPLVRAVETCSGSPFAVDSSSAYTVAATENGGAVLLAQPLPPSDAAPTTLVSELSTCAALTLAGGNVYYATHQASGSNSATFFSVSEGGGSPKMLASEEDWSPGTFVVSGGSLYFGPACDNGPCGVVGVLSATGGAPTYTAPIGNVSGGTGAIVADATGVYVATSGWACDNGNGGDAGLIVGGTTVVALAPDGTQTVLATTHDGSSVVSMAVDAKNLYWISGGNAWSAPKSGGTASPIAGNLGVPGVVIAPCSQESMGSSASFPTLVSDGTTVYIADPSSNAIFEVPAP